MLNLIVSDIHGSKSSALKIYELDKKYNFNNIILLGDINYNGARNVPPFDYSPIDVTEILNKIVYKIIFIKGNCDSRVDSFVFKKEFKDIEILNIKNFKFYLTHGDLISKDNLMLKDNEVLLYGHTHVFKLTKEKKHYLINPGSISIPKNNNPRTYLIFDDEKMLFSLYNLEDSLIAELKLENNL